MLFNVLATHYLCSVSSVSCWMNIFFSLIRFERRTSHISHRHLCSFQLSEDNRKVFNDKRYTANCPIYYCPNCDSSITCWNYDCSTTSSNWGCTYDILSVWLPIWIPNVWQLPLRIPNICSKYNCLVKCSNYYCSIYCPNYHCLISNSPNYLLSLRLFDYSFE